MKNYPYKIIGLLSVMIFLSASKSSAQQNETFFLLNTPSKYDTINDLKSDIADMVEENAQLQKKYLELKSEYNRIVKDAKRQQVAQQALENQAHQDRRTLEVELNKRQEIDQDNQYLESESLIREGQNAQLSRNLLDIEESNRLKKLQLADAQYERRELLLDLKSRALSLENLQKQNLTAEQMRQELQASQEKEKKLVELINEKGGGYADYKNQKTALQKDMDFYQQRVQKLESTYDVRQKEVDYLKEKNAYLTKTQQDILGDLQKEYQNLRIIYQAAQDEYDAFEKQINLALAKRSETEGLTQTFIEMDKANQELRRKIAQLQEKINQ